MTRSKTPPAYTRRLLKEADWVQLQSTSETPLHEQRLITSLSDGVAVSPLAQQALFTLNSPSVARLSALRAALRQVATPGLQADGGPYGELGLLMLATQVSLWDKHLDRRAAYQQKLAEAVAAHGLTITQAWEAAWFSLDTVGRRTMGQSYHAATRMTFDSTWSGWFTDQHSPQSQRHSFPPPPLPVQVQMVDRAVRAGKVGNWITEAGWRLMWLVDHHDPAWVASQLPGQVEAALAQLAQARTYAAERGSMLSGLAQLDDEVLAESLDTLAMALGRSLDLDWRNPALVAELPRCHARHRHLALQSRPASPNRSRFRI